MKQLVLLSLLVFLPILSFAQQDRVVIRFLDANTELPVKQVTILDHTGHPVSGSNSAGYCTLSFSSINSGLYLLAMHDGYQTDTLRTPGNIVLLTPLSVMLNTAVVRSGKTGKLLREPNEYVVDYLFDGDDIIVATWSGNNGSKAKLFLLNKDGDILARCKVPDEPLKLFRSCIGNYYCVCRNLFYPIAASAKGLTLNKPYNINLLHGLEQCDKSVNGNMFYRIVDRDNFKVSYGIITKGENQFRPLLQFDEKGKNIMTLIDSKAANSSFEEYRDILDFWNSEEYHEAYRRDLVRKLLDLGAIAHINMPLYTSGDSIIIFDYYKKRILYYASTGRPLGQMPVGFEWKQSQRFEILKDEPLNRFYIHRFDNKSQQTLEELDITTGTIISGKIVIEKHFPEQVKVENGDIYFLWQAGNAPATRQLYVQREGLPSYQVGKLGD